MKSKDKTGKLFISKLFFTMMIISIYALCRHIPLYGVDTVAYLKATSDTDALIYQTIGGDYYRYSVMAIGISPYMIATILSQLILLFRTKEAKTRTSPIKINRIALFITVILAVSMAIERSNGIIYSEISQKWFAVRFVAIIEMVTGALLMVWLSVRNKRYGIGGQGTIFLVNLVDSAMQTISKYDLDEIIIPLTIGFILMELMIFIENSEKRIPLQRISIHNIYAEKNYQSIKLNPIGVMPFMFASAFYMIPQFIVKILYMDFPNNEKIIFLHNNMNLTNLLGIAVYICGIYFLNIMFTYITINPKDIAEQFLKSGDSLIGIYPGKSTRRYIRKHLFIISFISSTIMSACVSISFYLTIYVGVPSDVAMLSTTIIMLAGLACRVYQEAKAIISIDSYKTFI